MDRHWPALARFLRRTLPIPMFVAAVGVSHAQAADEPLAAATPTAQATPVPRDAGTRDFFFGRPRGWVSIRGSWLKPAANGDLFRFVSDQLTIEKDDFETPAFITDVGFTVTPRVSVSGGVEFSRQTLSSEYRHFVDNRGAPINQRTALTQTNLSGSVRFALLDPGRSISRLAYVPRTITPYAGAGAGMFFYKFQQNGDFVDFATLRVFVDAFRSKGWTPSAHVFGGADLRIWRWLFLDVEGRYVWAHADLGADFVGFDGINLDGARFSTGARVVF
jgi:hypothetical protein